MFKHLQTKFLVLLAIMLMGGSYAWAEEATYSFGSLPTTGWSKNGGSQKLNNVTWTYSTCTYIGVSNDRLQIGSKNNPQTTAWTIQTPVSSFGENIVIKAVEITAYTTVESATYDIEVGSSSVKSGSLTTTSATYSAANLNVTSGNVVVTLTGSSTSKAIYLSNISVTYEEVSGPVKPTPELSFPQASYNATLGQTFTAPTLTTDPAGLSVTYASSETSVATVNENTGDVSLVGAGTTTITASFAGDDDYNASSASYQLTVIDPNAPGTQNNPYTVVQARAAIDAGSGTSKVYATGIVSEIPTAYSTEYSNITFNFVDEEGDTEFLQAYRCGGDEAANVQVGDIVVVYGNLTKYGSTYEFGQGCQLVSLTHPAAAVETPTFNPEAGTYAEAQNVTISCATNGATIYYTTDGTDPTTSSTQYTEAIAVSQTMTIKAIAVNGNDESSVAAATYHINSQDNPYTVAQALAFNEYPANNIYVHGIVSTAPTSLNNDGTLTYYISDNGEATNELEVYKGKDLENVVFDAVDDIQVGDIVTIYGNVKIYNGTKEFENGNYLVSFERPASTEPSISVANNNINVTAEGGEGTINVTYTNFSEVVADVEFYDAEGTTVTPDTYDWVTAGIDDNNNLYYLIEANEGAARTAYMKVYAFDNDDNEGYSELITITQDEYVAPVIPTGNSYVKVTSTADITSGQYLIVYEGDETHSAVAFNGGLETLDAANNTIGVTIENNVIAATTATEAAEFTIDVTAGTLKSASGKYIGVSTNSNGLKQTDNASTYTNSFSIDNGNAVIGAVFSQSEMTLRYNFSSNQERFRYYKSGQQAIQLYKKSQAAASTATITLNAACHDADGMVYGTYSNTSAFVVPSNLIVSVINIKDGKLNVSNYNNGDIVPANTGVMVSALDGGDYTVTLTDEQGTSVLGTDNNLRATGDGITADAMAEKDPACKYYRLTMHNGTQIGFWWGADKGAAFDVAANKAYLAVPAEAGSKIQGFTFGNGGDATEIVLNALQGEQNGEMYNLQGQKVGSEYKGIVIKNNKKYMVK